MPRARGMTGDHAEQETKDVMMKLFLTSIAALFLATGTANADYIQHHECGEKEIVVKFDSKTDAAIEYKITRNDKEHFLPNRLFRWRGPYADVMYYRGRRCGYIRGSAKEIE